MLHYRIVPHTLHFRQPAGTSRGVYTERRVWYVHFWYSERPEQVGTGECAPLPNLSCDNRPDYASRLNEACREAAENPAAWPAKAWRAFPSIVFGIETALRHLHTGTYALWDTPFSRGERGICINGLIWMGSYEEMYARLQEKVNAGFRCIKLKIGAIDFEREMDLLHLVRRRFPASEVELRVDANGAFTPDEAEEKLRRLAALELHSIEQPIRAGQPESMARLTTHTPLPIAFDEELIGCNTTEEKKELLDRLHPQYIVLKPSLHGGFSGCREWIAEAEQRGIGWWITSALESNIGLNAIAQWCATLRSPLPQGLGTGQLFTDNIDLPLMIRGDQLFFTPAR